MRVRERETKREKKRYNLLLVTILFNTIHDINALHKYSHLNKGILNRNFI